MKIVLETIVESISSRVDGSISIKIGTQEMDSSKVGELFSLRGKFVKTLISDTNISTLEEELVDSTQITAVKKNKTESQRLRAVLFRLHEQGEIQVDFEEYYKNQMEILINHFKGKLV